jgi:hypothetical protein
MSLLKHELEIVNLWTNFTRSFSESKPRELLASKKTQVGVMHAEMACGSQINDPFLTTFVTLFVQYVQDV